METGLDFGMVVALEEGWVVGNVLCLEVALSCMGNTWSLPCDVQGDVGSELVSVGSVEVDLGGGWDAVNCHIGVGIEEGGLIGGGVENI